MCLSEEPSHAHGQPQAGGQETLPQVSGYVLVSCQGREFLHKTQNLSLSLLIRKRPLHQPMIESGMGSGPVGLVVYRGEQMPDDSLLPGIDALVEFDRTADRRGCRCLEVATMD